MTTAGPTLFDLTGRVVIVTGGGKGIGRVYSGALAAAGALVVVADIDGAAAESTALSLGLERALWVATDIADEASTSAMAAAALARFGRIDGLVNNAGLMSALPRRPWHEIPLAEWDLVMTVNLRGLFLCCRAVYPAMKQQGRGRIVNISSSRVWDGTPNRLHYTASKAGVIGFTRALARELGPYDIAVNAVTPGLTLSETQLESSDPAYVAASTAGRAFARPQRPEDLVGTVLFLLSEASGFITGQTINVDGGRAMH